MPPKRARRAPRQTKLDFSPKPKPLSSRKISMSPKEPPDHVTKRRKLDVGQETAGGLKLGLPVRQNPMGMFGSSDNEVLSSGPSEREEDEMPIVKVPPKRLRQTTIRQEPVRAPAKGTARQPATKVFIVPQEISSGSEEDSEEIVSRRRKMSPRNRPVRPPAKRCRKSPEIAEDQLEEDSDSDSDDEEEEKKIEEREEKIIQRSRKSGTTQRSVRIPAKRGQKLPVLDELTTDDEEDHEDSDVDEIPRGIKKRQLDAQEQEDLQDDLEFLQSSPPADKGGLRSRHARPPTQREKALEALKRRRASSGGEALSSAVTPGRKRAIVLSESDSELEVIREEADNAKGVHVADEDDDDEDDDDDDDDGDEEEEEEAEEDSDGGENHEINALDMFHEDVNDVDFIDDTNNPIGAPADLVNIPIEFSSLSRAKPRELFKFAVEWMVHKKINPAFPRDDEIYTLAFRKLDDEVNGLANSKFSSSAWTPDFTRALRARPDILLNELGTHMRAVMSAHCEACNRKTHPASWEISLTGSPYNKDTLEPLIEDSSSDSASDSDTDASSSGDSERELNGEKPTYDATGEQIPPESKIFTLGSTCKANAQMAHTLHHWRYHLNSWVVDYLVREGHCTPEKIVERDTWREKKRQKYANKIVDKMEREGEIRSLHKLYKTQVDFAVETKNEFRQGWRRR